jgi:hypothetical protein
MAAPIEITTADDATKLGIRTALGTAPIMNPAFIGAVTATGSIGIKSGSYTASASPTTLTASRSITLPDSDISIGGGILTDLGSYLRVAGEVLFLSDFSSNIPVSFDGGHPAQFLVTGDTAITFPTSGTLATTAQVNLKANIASPTFTGTVSGVTSSMVGLGNVDNTSDANKPVSSAQQTALNLKANSASPTLTGNTTITGSGAASASTSIVSGSVFSGGTPLTALPKSLIQPVVNLYTSVTGIASTDIITVVGHSFANGDTVAFSSLTGGTGLSANSKYFVVSVSGNTFQLSLTSGGAAINFTTDITAGTITNYAVWSTSGTMLGVNAGPTFTGDLINLEKDGTSGFKVDSTGTATCSGFVSSGGVTLSGGSSVSFSGRSRIKSAADGEISFRNNADSSNANITAGNITASGTATATGGVIYGTFTVGTFPTTTYLEAVVTDALAPTQGATVVAGGSAKCKVMYNGTAKIVTAVL